MAGSDTAAGLPAPRSPTYSQSIVVQVGEARMVFIAGQVAAPAKKPGEDEFERQVRACYTQIRGFIEAAGGVMDDLVATTAHLTDIHRLPELASIRGELVGNPPPASTVVEATLADPGFLIEVTGIAVISGTRVPT